MIISRVDASLMLTDRVLVTLSGNLGGLLLYDALITLQEAEEIRDELDRVISLAHRGIPIEPIES